MRKPFKKLRSSRGETLAETLVSLLIIALAAALLAAAVSAAARIITAARSADADFYAALTAAETHAAVPERSAAVWRGEITAEFEVDVYASAPFRTYVLAED